MGDHDNDEDDINEPLDNNEDNGLENP